MNRPMRTTAQWWDETRSSETRLIDWLQRQFHGEAYAVSLMHHFLALYEDDMEQWVKPNFHFIAKQEALHAKWVGQLLFKRGVQPRMLDKRERYWGEVRHHIHSFDTYCAAIHLVENMALAKDVAISAHPATPADVHEVFRRLKVDETFHAGFYGLLAKPEALEEMSVHHRRGMEAIGLMDSEESMRAYVIPALPPQLDAASLNALKMKSTPVN
ncbi:MAG: hypothetical protein RL277_2733 [Planctomycetota bacterium]|jgi:rubrerythrin